MLTVTPFLWFDTQAEEAMNFYASIFPRSKVLSVNRVQGRVMSVEFELEGQKFMGLNAGPHHKFNEAVSFQVLCDTQEEIDSYWAKLSDDGDPKAQQCGWLKDRFGLSWQVVPKSMAEMLKAPGSPGAEQAMTAMLQMKKIDLPELKRAFAG